MGKVKAKLNKTTHSGDALPARGELSKPAVDTGAEAAFVPKKKAKKRKQHDNSDSDNEAQIIDPALSAKILASARRQRDELSDENDDDIGDADRMPPPSAPLDTTRGRKISLSAKATPSFADENFSSDEEDDDDMDDVKSLSEASIATLDPEEDRLLSAFMSNDPFEHKRLNDFIHQQINMKKAEVESVASGAPRGIQVCELQPRFVHMYRTIGELLSKYRSGKIPKAFKIIPKLVNWEQTLALTEPDKWSAAAMYQATRILVSNLGPVHCQRFINLVLLPRVRDDIAEYRKLNYHLYQALRKALFKPAPFFKGFLIPLCQSGTCTHREAVIVASVLAKCSVPVIHAGAVMIKLARMNYTGANSIFLRTLIDKKYTLALVVVDELCKHFHKFMDEERALPVLWHQCLLVFVQRYKTDITPVQRKQILALCRKHYHRQISEEVRREFTAAAQPSAPKKPRVRYADDMEMET